MLKVASRKDLEEAAGHPPAKPAPAAPAPPPTSDPHPGLEQMQAAATAMADAATIMAAASAASAKPRTLKATIIRDENQRMTGVTISIS